MIPAGWKKEPLGNWIEEFREKSTVNDQHPVLTSSRNGLILQSEYYGEAGRITSRDNIGFHVVPPMHITYRSRSDDGLFFFNRNETGITGIVSHYYPVFRFRGSDTFFLAMLEHIRNRIGDYAVGSSQRVLSLNALRSVEAIIPPVNEQGRIAEILSTWDRAIEATEKLIANSQAQKKALMQQLLTGKKRLPGFSGVWRTTTLAMVADVIVSNVDKKSVEGESRVRLCNYTDVYSRDKIERDQDFMVATATPAQIEKFALKVDDVIITKDSETPSDIAIPSVVASTASDLLCGYHLAILRPMEDCSGPFLYYLLQEPAARSYFATRANGATRFGLTLSAIEEAPLALPSAAEQKRIADVLDGEALRARALTASLAALKTQKSALMQQLLTGKRRVKLPSAQEEAA